MVAFSSFISNIQSYSSIYIDIKSMTKLHFGSDVSSHTHVHTTTTTSHIFILYNESSQISIRDRKIYLELTVARVQRFLET